MSAVGVFEMSLVVRKPAFCICENKDADQLRGNREADQRLCFRYIDSTIPVLSKPPAIFCDCTAWFVSDLVGNSEARFSHNETHMSIDIRKLCNNNNVREKAKISLRIRTAWSAHLFFSLLRWSSISYLEHWHCHFHIEALNLA